MKVQELYEVPPDPAVTEVPAYWKSGGYTASHNGPIRVHEMVVGKQVPPPEGLTEEEAGSYAIDTHCVVDQPQKVIPDEMCLVSREDIKTMTKDLETAGKAPMLVPVLKGNDFAPIYKVDSLIRHDHCYGSSSVRQTLSSGPATTTLASEELSPQPLVDDYFCHISNSLVEGGCISAVVKALPVHGDGIKRRHLCP